MTTKPDENDSQDRNNGIKTGPGNPPMAHRFQPGNPGRPKGSRNKLGEEFISALAEDFAKHGPAVIAKVREEKPDAYLKVVASLLPKDINLNVKPLDELTDDQLIDRLRRLTKEAAPLLARLDNAGEPEGGASRH